MFGQDSSKDSTSKGGFWWENNRQTQNKKYFILKTNISVLERLKNTTRLKETTGTWHLNAVHNHGEDPVLQVEIL